MTAMKSSRAQRQLPRRLATCLASALLAAAPSLAGEQEEFFESKVRPILASNCYACHAEAETSGLRLDSRSSMLQGGNRGPSVVPGDVNASLLLQAVSNRHPALRMPPAGPLEAHEVETLEMWIRAGAAWPESPREFFLTKIQPVLTQKCVGCHATSPQGGLRLDSREALLDGGKSGPAVVVGDAEASLLLTVIRHDDGKVQMPPSGQLPSETIAHFEKWIADGVAWADRERTLVYEISEEQRSHWAYQPVKKVEPPVVEGARWATNPIDRFVVAKLSEKGVAPGAQADKRTLLRRATYDLTGLPPTVEDMEAFLADDSPEAFADVVDRLLASRHYGERWGRHWLDLVRYADTAGDAGDFPVPEAYKYRNYVIDSFNSDKPYDAFVREQIAGDLLPFDNDDQRWEQTVGTGYIAISRRIGVSPHKLAHIRIEDTINNLSKTFLGLSVGCARCHDHKFDAIPTADYYALYGIFDSSIYPYPGSEHRPGRKDFVYRVGAEKAAEILSEHRAELKEWDRREREKFEEYQSFQQTKITDGRTRELVWEQLEELRVQRARFAETFPEMEIAYAIREGEPHDVNIQKMGDPELPGAEVRRGFLQILGGEKLPEDHPGSGRLALANWIADPQNPLTSRVMVNRIWHYHFGKGLVRSTSDFGVRGTPPTHPELLDYLTREFIDSGWSMKQLHRMVMLSETYRLSSDDVPASSAVDPANDLMWRANRRRLDAEQIRDSVLSFSGDLDVTPGGRHPMPHHLTYFYRQHEPFQEAYPTNRRTVYTMQQRIQKNPYLDLFDGPDGNIQLSERRSTTTTLQALFLMNSKFLHQQANAIAERTMARSPNTRARVEWAYETIFGRPPTRENLDAADSFLARAGEGQAGWAGYLRGMLSSNEFFFVD